MPFRLPGQHHSQYLRVALVLGFTIPRVPSFSFNDSTPIAKATGTWNSSVPTYVNTAPANFSFPAFASLRVDTNSNYLPLKFNYLRATVFDLDTLRQIATGDLGHRTLPAKSFPDIMLPLNFTYVASNSSDQTCMFFLQRSNQIPLIPNFVYLDQNMYLACRNKAFSPDNKRPRMYCFLSPSAFRLVLYCPSHEDPTCPRHGHRRTSFRTPSVDSDFRCSLPYRTIADARLK